MPSKKDSPRQPKARLATPLQFQELACDSIASVEDLLFTRTAKQLTEDLRSRGLKIPRDKSIMVARLIEHLSDSGAVLTATIG